MYEQCGITRHEPIKPLQRLCENKNLITARSPACFILRVVRSALIIKTMNNIIFKAETIKGEIIEACCVINKHDRLLLSNEAKAGFWIECKPDTLQVINKNKVEYCSYCVKSSCNGSCS